MRLKWVGEFHGSSPVSDDPVVVARLSIDGAVSPDLDAAVARLIARYADWFEPDPVIGGAMWEPGAARGLELAALAVGHWARAALNEDSGLVYAAGASLSPDGSVLLWVGFHDPMISRDAIMLGLRVLASADEAAAGRGLDALWEGCRAQHPDYYTRILMMAARKLDIPCLPFLPEVRVVQYGWGARGQLFLESSSNADGMVGNSLTRNKMVSKALFRRLGMATPDAVIVGDDSDLDAAITRIGFPCAVKPPAGGGGRGITALVRDREGLMPSLAHAREFDSQVMIEQHVPGDDHRLVVVGGKLIAAVRREPSRVIGDGKQTIGELLDTLNRQRPGNTVKSRYLLPIDRSAELDRHLALNGFDLGSILPPGQSQSLNSVANLGAGGTCAEVTAQVHPQIRAMAEQLAASAGLFTCGVDYLTTDVTLPPGQSGGMMIEFNAVPGLSALCAAGWSEADAGAPLLVDVGRIPVDLVILPSSTLSAELQAQRLRQLAPGEGWVCGHETAISFARSVCSRNEPWAAVRMALCNRELESLRVFCSPDELMLHGLPVDRLRSVSFEGTDLPLAWQQVLTRCTT